VQRVAESKAILMTLAKEESTPLELREKLQVVDDAALANIVLNSVTNNTGIQVVIPSMMQVKHLQTNVAAMEHSRFTADELSWLRDAMTRSSKRSLNSH
jgi:aryl-alcohol dehydrogenase-like predicted oxidoreductase